MPLTVLTGAQLRDRALALWAAKYLARGQALDVSKDSDAYAQADAFGLLAADIQQMVVEAALDIFPDTASEAGVLKHGDKIGLPRKVATPATLTVTQLGTGSYTTAGVLTAADGTRYSPAINGSVTVTGTVTLTALDAGVIGNRAAGTVLTWQSAPVGLAATVTVLATTSIGADVEAIEAYAARILAWWVDRPGAGNNADFVQWAESRAGVADAYVYPRCDGVSVGVLGAVCVVPCGAGAARVLAAGNVTDVQDYLRGEGAYAADGPRIPAFLAAEDVTVFAASDQPQAVAIAATLGAGYAFPWAGTRTVGTGSTTTTVELTAAIPAGLVNGSRVAVADPAVRGGFAVRTVTAASGTSFDVTEPLSAPPGVGTLVYPAPDNWEQIVAACVAVFDRLGPGIGYAPSLRFPAESASNPATLYQSALVAAVMGVPGLAGAPAGVPGVTACTVTLTGAVDPTKVVPTPFTVLTPGAITVTP